MISPSAYRPPTVVDMQEQRRRHYAESMEASYAKRLEDVKRSTRGMARRYGSTEPQLIQRASQGEYTAPEIKDESYYPKLSNEKAQAMVERMRQNLRDRQNVNGGLTIRMEPQEGYNADGFAHQTNQVDQIEVERLFSRGPNGDYSSSYFFDRENIPKKNFLDDAVSQYKERYESLSSLEYESEQEKLMTLSYLDQDFNAYAHTAFRRAGLSDEDVQIAADAFSREFRMGMISGQGIEKSQLNALRKLNELSPSLIQQVQYSGYSFDFGA